MKYIKKFNESKVDFEEFKETCYSHLSYLSDFGFKVNLVQLGNESAICIRHVESTSICKWIDIKNDIIPFITVLSKKYKLTTIRFNFTKIDPLRYSVEDIINDSIDVDYNANRISKGMYKPYYEPKLYYIEIPLGRNFFK